MKLLVVAAEATDETLESLGFGSSTSWFPISMKLLVHGEVFQGD